MTEIIILASFLIIICNEKMKISSKRLFFIIAFIIWIFEDLLLFFLSHRGKLRLQNSMGIMYFYPYLWVLSIFTY